MPYNGAGTFTLYSPGNPVVTGTTISSTWANNTLTDLATGLSTALTKDGQTTPTANIPMGGFKLTGLGAGTANGDAIRWQQSAAGVMTTIGDMVYASAANTVARLPSGVEMMPTALGRLTLTSNTPVTTSDVTDATTIYFTPYKGNVVSLYDGATWIPTIFTELSQATTDTTKSPAAVANNSNYDLFVWNDSGTLRCTRGPAWTSDTARGTGAGTTELEVLEGRYVNKIAITNGPAAQRGLYVGTVRSDGSAQINDSLALRHVWNNYNRVARPMRVVEATASWTYTTATWRQANAATSNQLDVVRGLNEDSQKFEVNGMHNNNGVNGYNASVGIGVDSTSANSAHFTTAANVGGASGITFDRAVYDGFPGLGRRYFTWLELSGAFGTTTWYGTGNINSAPYACGISGEVMA